MPREATSRRTGPDGRPVYIIGVKEKVYRALRGNLTQRQLAAKLTASSGLSFSKSHIADIDRGERMPSYRRATAMASFFGVEVDDLFFTKTLEVVA